MLMLKYELLQCLHDYQCAQKRDSSDQNLGEQAPGGICQNCARNEGQGEGDLHRALTKEPAGTDRELKVPYKDRIVAGKEIDELFAKHRIT
jgi:hypothetical protein